MSSSSKFTAIMTMISNFIATQLATTYMTHSRIIISFLVFVIEDHFLGKFKLIMYLFFILFKSIYKYLSNVIIFTFSSKDYWRLCIYTIIKAFYIITKRTWHMLLIFISV